TYLDHGQTGARKATTIEALWVSG
ncbi:hypothetical protein CEXT_317541, partial [Caerostris extrusa]